MTRYRTAIAAGLMAILVPVIAAGCAARSLGSFVEPGFEMWMIGSFEWADAEHLSTGDPRLDNNQFFQRAVRAAIERELTARGIERVDAGMGDVVVHYHASVTQRIDTGGLDERYGTCDGCEPSVFDAGTLTVDLVDGGTNRLVWRGWAERSITGVLEKQEAMEQEVELAVSMILARLPARRVAAR